MKKMFLAFIAIATLGASSMFAEVFYVESYASTSFGGSNKGYWDYLHNDNYVTYNAQADLWVTNYTYEGV